jgi:hypothetical protein
MGVLRREKQHTGCFSSTGLAGLIADAKEGLVVVMVVLLLRRRRD